MEIFTGGGEFFERYFGMRSVPWMPPVRLGFTKRITIYGFLAFRLWTVVHGPYQTQANTHEDTVDTFDWNLPFEMLATSS